MWLAKFRAQKTFFEALLTEKMQGDNETKYDETVNALTSNLHTYIVGSSWALKKAVSMKLHMYVKH